jgi:hypothetical protein
MHQAVDILKTQAELHSEDVYNAFLLRSLLTKSIGFSYGRKAMAH